MMTFWKSDSLNYFPFRWTDKIRITNGWVIIHLCMECAFIRILKWNLYIFVLIVWKAPEVRHSISEYFAIQFNTYNQALVEGEMFEMYPFLQWNSVFQCEEKHQPKETNKYFIQMIGFECNINVERWTYEKCAQMVLFDLIEVCIPLIYYEMPHIILVLFDFIQRTLNTGYKT